MTSLQRRPAENRGHGHRRSVTLTLDAALLDRAEQVTPELSATVEALLTAFLTQRTVEQDENQQTLDTIVDAVNRLHDRHGFLSDSFPSL